LLTLAGQLAATLALIVGVLQTGAGTFLGLRQLVGPPMTDPPQMIVSDLYRWVRRPLYTAGLVFIWLIPSMTLNLLALNIGLTAYIIVGAMLEERRLLHEFGAPYLAYGQRTPMLISGLRW
jgi:protein-S-isoprenylcysteine O-methyltransferase Ste14